MNLPVAVDNIEAKLTLCKLSTESTLVSAAVMIELSMPCALVALASATEFTLASEAAAPESVWPARSEEMSEAAEASAALAAAVAAEAIEAAMSVAAVCAEA